jgi:prepilin-type N-terminal cleavage/methylation domain-containing protein
MSLFVRPRRFGRWKSFTLVELLVVIAIIAILAALTLAAAEAVMTHAARSRAFSEIQAMTAALENYKADNGIYPQTNTFSSTNAYSSVDPTSPNYFECGQCLYQALTGKTNYEDTPVAGVKSYMNFKPSQLGNYNAPAGSSGAASTYVQDPWGYSYGYYTGDTASPQQAPPCNGTGFFDLWSTGGSLTTTSGGYTNTWISNWTQ